MNRFGHKYRLVLVTLLALAVIAAGIMAITNPKINNYHMGAGGRSAGGGYTLMGSIGQHDAGVTLSGGEFTLAGGLWGAGGIIDHLIYIPLVLR
jgi:hypothetical protein